MVRSCVDGHYLCSVPLSEARDMIGENSDGSERLGSDGKPLQAVAKRLNRLKEPLRQIKMMAPMRTAKTSPCTITCSEVEKNAVVHEGAVIHAKDSIRALDAASAKVKVWPEVHDHKSPTISAGVAIGVFCIYPPAVERVVTFA